MSDRDTLRVERDLIERADHDLVVDQLLDRVQAAEARLLRLHEGLRKWQSRADRGFDPEETDESVGYWHGVRRVCADLAALLVPPVAPAQRTGEDEVARVEPSVPCAASVGSTASEQSGVVTDAKRTEPEHQNPLDADTWIYRNG